MKERPELSGQTGRGLLWTAIAAYWGITVLWADFTEVFSQIHQSRPTHT